jgi:hypothetical protein
MSEADEFFENRGNVKDSRRRIAERLDQLGVLYAVVGALALFEHGYRRFTQGVDLLVPRGALERIHVELEGLGYLPPFVNSKNLRDTQTGVRIEFLVAGEYPGDGKPKPVAFPDPSTCSVLIDGIRYLNLEKLVELKLASGMTNPGRLKDLADVMELVKAIKLPRDFSQKLDPYVRGRFEELWDGAQQDLGEAEGG